LKITAVEIAAYAEPPRRAGGGRRETGCVVELRTDTGPDGLSVARAVAAPGIRQLACDVLLGRDPRGVTALWQDMIEVLRREPERASRRGAAALDLALWDLKAKAAGEPLWKTLGGARPRANAHAVGSLALSDDQLPGQLLSWAREHGVRGAKLEVGLDEESDLRRLGILRRVLAGATPDPVLAIDAGERWSPKEAIRRIGELEAQFDLGWVEAPARQHDFAGLKRVSEAVRAAVCAGRGLAGLEAFLPHFHHHALDIVQIDVGELGVTGALQLADAAYGYELPVILAAAPGNLHAHLSSAMPYFMSMEVRDARPPEPFLGTDVRIEAGAAVAGDAPGLGLAIDRAALAAAAAMERST
jgi:L-alanine-DL-glutamate epimerase-like enolase superfamily enzyme